MINTVITCIIIMQNCRHVREGRITCLFYRGSKLEPFLAVTVNNPCLDTDVPVCVLAVHVLWSWLVVGLSWSLFSPTVTQ